MNERIKELSLQSANEIADLFNPGFFDDRMVYDVAEINKKFAKLIIQDCVDINKQELSFAAFERLMNKYHDLLLNENQNKI